jgi:hypothetical protein
MGNQLRKCRSVFVLLAVGCIPLARPRGPVACPPTPPSASDRICLDCHGFSLGIGVPYTLVIDGRIAATVIAPGDSVKADTAWARVDPNTIRDIEVIRAPRAQELYPASAGDIVAVRRCY